MRAKREVHRLSGYLIEGAVWGSPSTQNIYLFLFLLPIAGISISIHFRTVVANSSNFHPVCYLYSPDELNPSDSIFNNDVMQNGISRIVKSGRFNHFLLKSGMLQPHYITQGVEYPLIYSHTTWH